MISGGGSQTKVGHRITRSMMDPGFLSEVLKTPGGKKMLDCIQCGVCGGSCHARFAMDHSPMQVIKMVELGLKEDALSSSTIWICASCYTCASRCPRGIDIPLLMSALKNTAMRNGISYRGKKQLFHRAFTRVVRRYGRLNEPLLFAMLLRKSGLRGVLRGALMGLRMWRKGRIRYSPSKIEKMPQIKALSGEAR